MAKTKTTPATPATTVDHTKYNMDALMEIGFENITHTGIATTPEQVPVTETPMPDTPQQVTIDGQTVTPTEPMRMVHIPTGKDFLLHHIALSPDTATRWEYSRIGVMDIRGLGQAVYIGVNLTHSGEDLQIEEIACSMVRQNCASCQKDTNGCEDCPLNVLTLDDVKTGKLVPEPIEFVLERVNRK